jgi:pimeloyl-ACP methyl ester carboxylesterase
MRRSTQPRAMTTVFVHSTGTGPFMWDFVPEDVVPAAARLAPPNLGYPPLRPFPRGEAFAVPDDVRHLLAALPAEGPLDLVAHSYGGLVAMRAALALGPRLRSLFLVEPVMFGAILKDPTADPEVARQMADFLAHPWFLSDEARGGTERWLELFIDYWNRPGSWARLPEPVRQHNLAMGWKMFCEVRAVFLESGPYEDSPLPARPVTLVMGERSPAGSREVVRALSKRHSHARVVELPGTGHMAPLTHPMKVAEALRAHFAALPSVP